jgi:hypothetical protein
MMDRRSSLVLVLAGVVALAGCGDDGAGGGGDGGSSGTGTGLSTGSGAGSGSGGACAGGPLSSPIAGCAPTVLASSGDPHQDCVDRINQFRAECQCLPPLGRWTSGEACADQDAEYDSTNGAHAGFIDNICESGWAQNECPDWPSVDVVVEGCLQAMWDEGPGEPFEAHGHYINMSSTDYTEVACGFYTTPGGTVWAAQSFR